MCILRSEFGFQISLCFEYIIIIEIKTERMTSAATSTDLDFSTIENYSADVTTNDNTPVENTDGTNSMGIVHSVIASVGIVTNLTVILIFLKHSKLRRKIPNICIINQVRYLFRELTF